jgi:hypothetical protein
MRTPISMYVHFFLAASLPGFAQEHRSVPTSR